MLSTAAWLGRDSYDPHDPIAFEYGGVRYETNGGGYLEGIGGQRRSGRSIRAPRRRGVRRWIAYCTAPDGDTVNCRSAGPKARAPVSGCAA